MRPPDAPAHLFAPVRDRYGTRLALVFGNHAPGGVCPYAARARCHHCDIGLGEGRAFDTAANLRRLAFFQRHYGEALERVDHLVIYDSGSVLSEKELPREVLAAVLAYARSLPACRVVSLDSREAFITRRSVRFAAETLGPGRVVRPILGLESASEHVRDVVLDKRMPMRSIVRALDAIAAVGRELGPSRVGVDVNLLVGAPGIATDEVAPDARRSAEVALLLASERDLALDLNVHPYYPSARGLARFPDHPRCSLPLLARALDQIHRVRDERAPSAGVFVGLDDEGHDRELAWRGRAMAALVRYNGTADRAAIAALLES